MSICKPAQSVIRQAEAFVPTPWGNFKMIAYSASEQDWMPHVALVHEQFAPGGSVLVRLHSECLTGDLFGSQRCDCGEQLHAALTQLAAQGGILLYLRQEGRGIGLINKLKAYELQDKGLNTIDANLHLGLEVDARQYDIAVDMLRDLGVDAIRLLTNNPDKLQAFEHQEVRVVERVPIIIPPHEHNEDYLKTKQGKMGHLLGMLM